jgi:hypothetical protein
LINFGSEVVGSRYRYGIVFLASCDASSLTGASLVIDPVDSQ